MKLLIVGASGFIGKNLVEAVAGLSPEIEITATYRQSRDFAQFSAIHNCQPLQIDLLESAEDFSAYTTAIYLSGNADHAAAAEKPEMDLQLNTVALLRFLKTFRGHLIYLSSGAVYYGLQGLVSVASTVAPTFTYGISKLASEYYARAARENGQLARLTIFRLFYAYGRYDKPRRLVPRIMQHVAEGNQKPFALNGTGISETSPLDARDVAAILLQSALTGTEGLYDLCGTEYLKLEAAVSEIGHGLGAAVSARNNGIPEATPVVFRADATATWETFGLALPRTLREGVRQFKEWLASRQGN